MTDSWDPGKPIEELTDGELLAQYRYVIAEMSEEAPRMREGNDRPADVLLQEIRRRGLYVPREADAGTPEREEQEPHRRRSSWPRGPDEE